MAVSTPLQREQYYYRQVQGTLTSLSCWIRTKRQEILKCPGLADETKNKVELRIQALAKELNAASEEFRQYMGRVREARKEKQGEIRTILGETLDITAHRQNQTARKAATRKRHYERTKDAVSAANKAKRKDARRTHTRKVKRDTLHEAWFPHNSETTKGTE